MPDSRKNTLRLIDMNSDNRIDGDANMDISIVSVRLQTAGLSQQEQDATDTGAATTQMMNATAP